MRYTAVRPAHRRTGQSSTSCSARARRRQAKPSMQRTSPQSRRSWSCKATGESTQTPLLRDGGPVSH